MHGLAPKTAVPKDRASKVLPGRASVNAADLMLVCVNINGLRKKKKRVLLGKLLFDLRAGVGVVTETHLRKSELKKVRISNYHILTEYCRPTAIGEHIGGGVLILAHNSLSATEEDKIPGLLPHVEHCTVSLYLSNQEAKSVRLTGMYIPSTSTPAIKRKCIETITTMGQEGGTEEKPSHIIAGDLTVMVWWSSYTEWLHEEGIMELTNPERPTFATGSTLDKFLLTPGTYVPPSLLPSPPGTLQEGLRDGEALQYPGAVVDCSHISDHIPIVLPLTYQPPGRPKGRRKLNFQTFGRGRLETQKCALPRTGRPQKLRSGQ